MRAFRIACMLSVLVASIASQPKDKLAISGSVQKELQSFGLTDAKLMRLKAHGIDVERSLMEAHELDEKGKAVFSDLVIIGTVRQVVDMPGPDSKNNPFHSKITIDVDSVLKGKLPRNRMVEILRQSGPTTGAFRKVVSSDVRLTQGEHVLAFLQRPENNSFLRAYYRAYFESLQSGANGDCYWLDPSFSFPIRGDKVTVNRKERQLDEVMKNVLLIDSILSTVE